MISPAQQGGQGSAHSRVGIYAPEAFSADAALDLAAAAARCAYPRNRPLRPRPETNARGKNRQFMQKCIVTEEFASEETFGQAAAVFRRPDGARIHGQIARAAGRGRDGS